MRRNGGAEWRAATPSTRFTPERPRCNSPAQWGHSAIFHNVRIGSGHCADATSECASARGARRAAPLVYRGAAGPRSGSAGRAVFGGCRFGELYVLTTRGRAQPSALRRPPSARPSGARIGAIDPQPPHRRTSRRVYHTRSGRPPRGETSRASTCGRNTVDHSRG